MAPNARLRPQNKVPKIALSGLRSAEPRVYEFTT
jgi:hypothetical protein